MTITSSGQLKFSDLQTEFGGTNPISLSEYYAGNLVAPGTTGNSGAIPASGNPLNLGKFYGSAAAGVLWGSRFIKVGPITQSDTPPTVRYLNGKFFVLSSPDNPTSLTYSTDSTATSWITTSIANGTYYGPDSTAVNSYTPYIYDIASNGSIYVVAGDSLGPAATTAPTGVLATSTDLVNWTVYSFLNGFSPRRIIYSPEKSLFVGIGFYKLFTSTDGITWTQRALPSGCPRWNNIIWNGFVFVATGTGYIAYSTDGINWTASSGLNINYIYYDVAWGNNIFVVGTNNSGAVYTSPNGVTWTLRTVPEIGRAHV